MGEWLTSRGIFGYVNLMLVVFYGFAMFPAITHSSQDPFILGYSMNYLILLVVLLSPALMLAAAFVFASAASNRLALGSMVFALGGLELLLGAFLPVPDYDQDIQRMPKPYVMFGGKPDESSVPHNSMGFRGRRPPRAKPVGVSRVFVVGGSTVYDGDPVATSIPGQLQTYFNENGDNVEVYNFGVVSSVTGQELHLLLETLVDYSPDLVIFYGGGNDVFQPYAYDPRPGYPFNYLVVEDGVRFMTRGGTFGEHLHLWMTKTHLFNAIPELAKILLGVDERLEELRHHEGHATLPWQQRIAESYVTNIAKAHQVSRGFGFQVAVVLQPMISFKDILVENEKTVAPDQDLAQHVRSTFDLIRRGLESLSSRLEEVGDPFLYLDVSTIFKNSEDDVFKDIIHVYNPFNAVIAQQIYSGGLRSYVHTLATLSPR